MNYPPYWPRPIELNDSWDEYFEFYVRGNKEDHWPEPDENDDEACTAQHIAQSAAELETVRRLQIAYNFVDIEDVTPIEGKQLSVLLEQALKWVEEARDSFMADAMTAAEHYRDRAKDEYQYQASDADKFAYELKELLGRK